jgi:hypothetical protein
LANEEANKNQLAQLLCRNWLRMASFIITAQLYRLHADEKMACCRSYPLAPPQRLLRLVLLCLRGR